MARKKNLLRIQNITDEYIDKAATDDITFSKFLNSNKGYVEKVVLKFTKRYSSEFDDLYQIGIMALYKALKKFDSKRSDASKFSTFAWTVIYNDVLRLVEENNKLRKHENSMERYRNTKKDSNEDSDYNERYWKPITQKPDNFVERILDEMTREQHLNAFSELEKKIIKLKTEKYTMNEIAEITNKNYHTLKAIYYNAVQKPEYKNFINAT